MSAFTTKQIMCNAGLSSGAFKKAHDQLQRSVVDLAWTMFRVRLYKTDSEAVVLRCSCGNKLHRRSRVKTGFSDLIGCVPPTGRLLCMEIKTGSAKPRENQNERAEELIGDGAAVFVITSMAEAEDALRMMIVGERRKFDLLEMATQ